MKSTWQMQPQVRINMINISEVARNIQNKQQGLRMKFFGKSQSDASDRETEAEEIESSLDFGLLARAQRRQATPQTKKPTSRPRAKESERRRRVEAPKAPSPEQSPHFKKPPPRRRASPPQPRTLRRISSGSGTESEGVDDKPKPKPKAAEVKASPQFKKPAAPPRRPVAVSTSSDAGYMSEPSTRKRKEAPTPPSSSRKAVVAQAKKPKQDKPADDSFVSNSSLFSNLHDSVSVCLTRNKSRLNTSLHQSFVSLGPTTLDTSISILPNWIAEAHQKRSQAPSQILAKVQYKTEPLSDKLDDQSLMPPPKMPVPSTSKNDPKIRIQAGKENTREIRNWCFKQNDSGSHSLQGFDLVKNSRITSSEIVYANWRTVKTKRTTYQLLGPIDVEQLIKEKVPVSMMTHFTNGFPDDWKELIASCTSDQPCADVVVREGVSNRVKRRLSQSAKEPLKISTAENPVHLPLRLHEEVQPLERMSESSLADTLDTALSQSEVEESEPSILPISLRKWSIERLCLNNEYKYNLTGFVNGKKRHFKLEKVSVIDSRVLGCDEEHIELVGPMHQDEGCPDYVANAFKNGFPADFMDVLKSGETSLPVETSVRRTGRKIVAPLKFWEGEKLDVVGGKTMVRKKAMDDWKSISQKSNNPATPKPKPATKKPRAVKEKTKAIFSDDSDGDDFVRNMKTIKPTSKGAKKKAEFRAKYRDEATYRDLDFFQNPNRLDTSADEFDKELATPVKRLKKTTNNCLSPMAAFVSNQSFSDSESSDGERDEDELTDRRKKKTYEKFVYHETTKPKKIQQNGAAKRPIVQSKVKKSDLRDMKTFLTKNLNRKKEYDRKLRLGNDSDFSDYDDEMM